MPNWTFDEITRQGTLELRKGAGVDHSRSLGGNTVNYDGQNEIVSVVFANPLATMNMNMTGLKPADRDAMYGLMKHYTLFGKKPDG